MAYIGKEELVGGGADDDVLDVGRVVDLNECLHTGLYTVSS